MSRSRALRGLARAAAVLVIASGIPEVCAADLAGITRIASGTYHACAVDSSGGVLCWGWNARGQLGDGTTTNRKSAVRVANLRARIVSVTTGTHHTCALTAGGGVKCWGGNESGQLGDNSVNDHALAADVSGLESGVTSVSAGVTHTCALDAAGGVKCWGHMGGALQLVPVTVPGLESGVKAISAGENFTCVVTVAGAARCWGVNGRGNLGDGTTLTRSVPVDVVGLGSGVTGIAAGNNIFGFIGGSGLAGGNQHACALLASGKVMCWGYNYTGQLGDGTTVNQSFPVEVAGLPAGAVAIAVGGTHSCALVTGQGVWCWGDDSQGQLADASFTNHPHPIAVPGTGGASAVAAGAAHVCALSAGGTVLCWGNDGYGQLGDDFSFGVPVPVDVPALGAGVANLAAGVIHTCAVGVQGGASCWGDNNTGYLGTGTFAQQSVPAAVVGLSSGVRQIAAGQQHTCALTTAGGVKCWGSNYFLQSGGSTGFNPAPLPVDVIPAGSGVTAISAGGQHTCALAASGGVRCWGDNTQGQLGATPNLGSFAPVDVATLAADVVAIAAGHRHTCALLSAGTVKCWGANGSGQLGDGTTINRFEPVAVAGLAPGITALAAGSAHTCALSGSGIVQCWGLNHHGQLGDGSTSRRAAPTNVAGMPAGAVAIVAARSLIDEGVNLASHTCAVLQDGSAACWGYNGHGQLGDGTTLDRATPVRVVTPAGIGALSGVSAIAAGGAHTCALLTGGFVKCWGYRYYGQLGDGIDGRHATPAAVVAPPDRMVVEFHNAVLDHYFITADPDEAAAIDQGAAGPGWSRTGGSFASGGTSAVCRFYGSVTPGPNSHFYALDGTECQSLMDLQFPPGDPRRATTKSWNFESFDFRASRPADTDCGAAATPVYRAYNNGFARGLDSNHRITADRAAIGDVVARGWVDEGVVMCAPR